MCELTDSRGDFWRRIYAHVSEPVRFAGFVFHRDHDVQALRNKQATRRADQAMAELRALEANDKAVFEALESCAFRIGYRKPELRGALCNAYRAGDHAELGRIVAGIMREELEEKAADEAADGCWDVEQAEDRELERSAA